MENPDLYQGDIAGIDRTTDRNALPDDIKKWPNGVIPYRIDLALDDLKDEIESAMKYIMDRTCLKFVRRENRERDFIRVFYGDGCYSHWGKTGKAQPLSLGLGCESFGTIIHELIHAIGFDHEQTRSDRDDYLLIFYQNIDPESLDQFMKLKPHENRLINQFDYDSIMLYGEKTFSRDGRSKTMKAKKRASGCWTWTRRTSPATVTSTESMYSTTARTLDNQLSFPLDFEICILSAKLTADFCVQQWQSFGIWHCGSNMQVFVVLSFLVVAWGLPWNPMENPDLYQGDIVGIDSVDDRNAIPNNTRRWPGGVIPYKIDKGLDDLKDEIAKAMKHIMDQTCIKFVPWDGLERGYIKIFPRRWLLLILGKNWKNPTSIPGIRISDRDDYLIIYWQNIWPDALDQFDKLKPEQNRLINEFDYNSIMLYGEKTFSKDGWSKTMKARKKGIKILDVIKKGKLSESDVYRINHLYECDKQK
ncbi:astacin-like metalloprotease toxin 1 [Caerostris extrusa]|uniref:Metalloendopeptidase n=1 Tax=Caerostris extrusa TaxID=172846 RepID=A0AAV4RQD3_CAEEX|nr:astacin-like metalloprotease toxin 1 [Caerostris extrusa]